MPNQMRFGSQRVDAVLFRAPLLQPSLHSLAPVFACAVGYFGVGWIGVRDPAGVYWLPNSLLLAALLLHRPRWWAALLASVTAIHFLSLPGSQPASDRLCTLLCNEGLACCAAVVLHAIRSGRRIDEVEGLSLSQLILCLLLPPTLLLMLGSNTTWSGVLSAIGLHLDCCLVAGAVASLVAFVTVTPATMTLCRNDCESMTLRHLAETAALVALGWCLLTAALLLQPLDGFELFLFALAICSLAHTSGNLGQASNLDTLAKALRRARLRLRDSIERQNLLLRSTHDLILWWNVRRDSIRCGSNVRTYFGCFRNVSKGWQLWSECVGNDDRARVLDELRQLFDAGGRLWRSEFQVRRRDGVAVPVRCRGILVRDVRGRPWRMVVALRDITDARRAEESSRALARSSRLATIGEITATITHEVNQPLAAILNNAETALLLLKDGRGEPDMIREILEDIRDDDLRASQIVRRTRALLQDQELVRERIDLNDVVTRAVNLLSDHARRRAIRLTMSLASIPPVQADALHLEQVVINIVNNALDATAAGREARWQVEVFTRSIQTRVQVGVKDTGCGIPAADLERIFDSLHTTKAHGMGLGLSLARAIVVAHGGRIFAENNKQGPGVTVWVELPAITCANHSCLRAPSPS